MKEKQKAVYITKIASMYRPPLTPSRQVLLLCATKNPPDYA